MTVLPLIWARRELRGGLKGFRVLIACLALGVTAIAAAGSLRAGIERTLAEDARALLGGDLELRQSHQPIDPAVLAGLGRLSQLVEMRAMAIRPDGASRSLVELKAVDGAYPLAGTVVTEPALPLADLLAWRDGAWGAVADANLLTRLSLAVGDTVTVGDAVLQIRAVLRHEPDRVAAAISFGPRLMVAAPAAAASGLMLPGSLIRYAARLELASGQTVPEVRARLAAAHPDAPWSLRDTGSAAPGLERFLGMLSQFLTLVGLTALLTGGIGVANAVRAYLDGRAQAIATLKAVGAPARTVLATYGLLVGGLSLAGTALGLLAGGLLPVLVVALAGDRLPVAARLGIYPQPLAIAAAFGLLTAALFTLGPLARARAVSALTLFRDQDAAAPWRDRRVLLILAAIVLALAGLTIGTAAAPLLAAGFLAAAAAALGLFRLLAWLLPKAAAALLLRGWGRSIAVRLALSALQRSGGAAVSMMVSLGLGLTVMVCIAQVESNLARQFGERLPREAPSFYFIDIQPDQVAAFVHLVQGADPGAVIAQAAMVRGRITAIKGRPLSEVAVAEDTQWAARGDRGLSAAATPPTGTRLTAGQWWPPDYAGPPLVSLDARVAKGFGLTVGDTMAVNVLGREMTLTVASLREIEWSGLSMNFALLLSPGALNGAPSTTIATVHSPAGRDDAIERAVTDALPNVSAIRVKEALETVRSVIADADLAVRLAGLATLVSGGLVLAGAIAAGHRRRVRESVVMKVLGAERGQLWRAYLGEFALIGLWTGLAAAALGTAAAWAILRLVMRADWAFLPQTAGLTLAACMAASLLAGFVGTWRALGTKAAPLLRGE